MQTQLRVLGAALIALVLSVAGCGGGGGGGALSPPTISGLVYSPTSVPVTSATNLSVSGSVNFADSGGDVSSLILTITDANGNQVSTSTQAIPNTGGLTAGTLAGTFIVTAPNVGTYTVRVKLTDSQGSASNELTGSFQVVPVSNQSTLITATGPSPLSLMQANGSLYWSESGTAAMRSIPVSGGTAAVLATRMVNPQAIAFAGSDLIWVDDRPEGPGNCGTDTTTRFINRTTVSGVTTPLASALNCPSFAGVDVVVEGNTVYWISSTRSPDLYFIHATQLAGGATTTLRTSPSPIVAMKSAGGTLYWMENMFPVPTAAILSWPTGGGSISTLASNFATQANTFALDGGNVYYSTVNYPVTYPGTATLLAQPLAGGLPLMLSNSISTPTRIEVIGGQVVWVESHLVGGNTTGAVSGSVNKVPTSGGAVTALATTSASVIDLAIVGGSAVWSESTGATHGETGAIRSVPVVSGNVITLVQGGDAPRRLAVDSNATLHWTEGGQVGLVEGFARVARLNSSGAVQTVLSGISSARPAFAATSTDLYVADRYRIKRLPLAGGMPVTVAADDGDIAGLVVDGNTVYWNSTLRVSARMAPVTGGNVSILVDAGAQTPGGPIHLSANGNLYWVSGAGTLVSVPAIGGSLSVVAQGVSADLAVDASNAYYMDPASGNIQKLPLGGGVPTTLASVGFAPLSLPLVLDGANLYWLDGNSISKVPVNGGATTPILYVSPGSSAPAADGGASFAVDAARVYVAQPPAQDIRASTK